MANPEHLEILKQGVEVWNRWREEKAEIYPDLSGADLSGANLSRANLSETDLNRANLIEVNLREADLSRADICGANLCGAILRFTTFGNVDLSEVEGLENMRHYGSSYVDINTLFRSKGKIPETFLRGVGAPDIFIKAVPKFKSSQKVVKSKKNKG